MSTFGSTSSKEKSLVILRYFYEEITNSSDKFFSDLLKNLLLLLPSFANNVTLLKTWVFGNLVDFLSSSDLEILQGTFCLIHYGDFF